MQLLDGGYEKSSEWQKVVFLFCLRLREVGASFLTYMLLGLYVKTDTIHIMINLAIAMDEQAIKGLLKSIGDKWKTLDHGASTLVVVGFDQRLGGGQSYSMRLSWELVLMIYKQERLGYKSKITR